MKMSAWLGLLVTVSLAAPALSDPLVQSYTTQGNLEVTHKLDCIGLADVRNTHTAADLVGAMDKCVRAARYDDAFGLYLLAGAFARFDVLRVPDQSAHDAFSVLMMNTTGAWSDQQRTSFMALKDKYAADNSPSMAAVCARAWALGPPGYEPTYMSKHGMGAFFGTDKSGTPAGFDANAAWEKVAESYLRCPAAAHSTR